MKMLFTLIFAVLLLTACANPPQQTPTQSIPGTPAPTTTITPLPTVTPRPTSTVYVFTPKPRPPTRTPKPTEPLRQYFTPTTGPTITPYPTNITGHELEKIGYTRVYRDSFTVSEQVSYIVDLYIDPSFLGNRLPAYRQTQETEGCRMAFYQSNEQGDEFISSMPAPTFPEGSIYAGYPVSCAPYDWDNIGNYWWYKPPDAETFQLLNLKGAWSDINQNGFPEFAVLYQYCSDACLDYGAIDLHFYEFQSETIVVDITANLPGVIEPFNLLHSKTPVEFYVYDPTLWYCYKWCVIHTWWIYVWDGEKFVDISPKYANEYRNTVTAIKNRIQQNKGDSFPDKDILEILFEYEKVGLRDEAIQTFLEITNPNLWADASSEELCWLQFVRALAQDDYQKNQPFRLSELGFQLAADFTYLVPRVLQLQPLDQEKYDLSACSLFLPTPQP